MIYEAFLMLHSFVRWLVVFSALGAVGMSVAGLSQGRAFSVTQKKVNTVFLAVLHTNVIIGALLYFGLSPVTEAIFANFGAAMKDSQLRFWAVEHIFGMSLAATFATIGVIKVKRAKTDPDKHKRGAIFFGLSTVCLLASIPWPFMPAGRAATETGLARAPRA